ncbi:ribulose-phosphate 3-epimerase [Butyricicoccus sp. 1XD8-22]|nr:ribulose-phosphate 3-epimerase [Butyricicoccus sp. 1XD8-22]
MEIKLSPSILSADFANLSRDVKTAVDAGAEYVHVDVMDGHFVPNITIGAPVVKALRKETGAVLDVHLMISDPDKYLDDFIAAGSDIITVHYESNGDTAEQLKKIRAAGVRAAVVIKPKTPVADIVPLLPLCDMVLVMTVEPGFGGQGFIPECMDKIRELRKAISDGGFPCELEIDGGAKLTNTADIVAAGADVIVAGSAVFGGDIADNVRKFHEVFRTGAERAEWVK